MASDPPFKLAPHLTEDEAKLLLSSQGKESEETGTPGLTRAEKKRDREKQRRSEINQGYDHLLDLLFRIDPKIRREAEVQAKRGKEDQPLLNRLEIINSACAVLERIHNENEERKMVILHLSRGLLASGNNGDPPRPPPPSLVANAASLAPSAALGVPNAASLGAPSTASLLARQNIERQELQRQQMEMDAVASSVAGIPPPRRNAAARFLPEPSTGIDYPTQSAALMGHPHGFGERNPMPGSFLAGGSSALAASQLYPNDVTLGASDPRNASLEDSQRNYRARLNQLLLEGEELQNQAAALGVARSLPGLVSRASTGGIPESSVAMSGDSMRQAMMREQTISQAAAARTQGGLPSESMLYEQASKRFRNAY